MKPMVVVLYEDSRVSGADFGPHQLVVDLVADLLEEDTWKVAPLIDARTTNSNGNLIKMARDLETVAPGGQTVIAVPDEDKIRTALSLDKGACRRQVIEALTKGCDVPERLTIVLLERNVESIITALEPEARQLGLEQALFDDAIAKVRVARDRIFERASKPGYRQTRGNLLEALPCLGRLRDRILTALKDDRAT